MQPRDTRGAGILDALEAKTEIAPYATDTYGGRRYWLSSKDAGPNAFDTTLDTIAPDWRSHITRTP